MRRGETAIQSMWSPIYNQLGRFGEPEEVAAAVAFLCSDEVSLFVGQTIGPNSGDVML